MKKKINKMVKNNKTNKYGKILAILIFASLIILLISSFKPINEVCPDCDKFHLKFHFYNPEIHECTKCYNCVNGECATVDYDFPNDHCLKCVDYRKKSEKELEIDYCNTCVGGLWEYNFECKKGFRTYFVSKEMCKELRGELIRKSCERNCKCEEYSETDYTKLYGREKEVEIYSHCNKAIPKFLYEEIYGKYRNAFIITNITGEVAYIYLYIGDGDNIIQDWEGV